MLPRLEIKECPGTAPGSLTGPLAEVPSPYAMAHLCLASRGVVTAAIGRMPFSRPCGLPEYVLHPAWPAPMDELGRAQGRHSRELGQRQSSFVAHGPRLQSKDGRRAAQGLSRLLSLPVPHPLYKNAGGHPPALGSHLSQGAKSFITYRGNESQANAKGHDTLQSQLAVKRFQAGGTHPVVHARRRRRPRCCPQRNSRCDSCPLAFCRLFFGTICWLGSPLHKRWGYFQESRARRQRLQPGLSPPVEHRGHSLYRQRHRSDNDQRSG